MPGKKRLAYLYQQWQKGLCTPHELQELLDAYDELTVPGMEYRLIPPAAETENKRKQHFKEVKDYLVQHGHWQEQRDKTRFWKWAAAAAVITLVATAGYFLMVRQPATNTAFAYTQQAVQHDRQVTLPDGSTVILHNGSTLQFDESSFNKSNRQVMLTGEAYFDVKHDAGKPFIIQAGKTKTTVLGTAFNIRQLGDSVAVTVTRGKVKVESVNRTIAVLTANQQVVYAKEKAVQQQVQPQQTVAWVRTGLQFDGETLEQIATQLRQRYNVQLLLDGDKLLNCNITALDAFSGTETIDEVLSFICPIVNASYTKSGNTYTVTGKGCTE